MNKTLQFEQIHPGHRPEWTIPRPLKMALVQEAHATFCQQAVEEGIQMHQAHLEKLDSQFSSVDYLLAIANRPRPISAEIEKAKEHMKQLTETLAGLIKIRTGIGTTVETLFEDYVRKNIPAYVQGLAALNHIKDWERGLDRFDHRLAEYLKTLGQARNNVVAGYDRQKKTMTATADQLVVEAQLAGSRLEEEIHFVNQLSDLHDKAIAGTVCARANLPKVPYAPYAKWTADLRTFEIGSMQVEFNRILKIVEILKTSGVTVLKEAIGKTSAQHHELAQSFVVNLLTHSRRYAAAHWVIPADTKEVIDTLETRFCHGREIHFDFNQVS